MLLLQNELSDVSLFSPILFAFLLLIVWPSISIAYDFSDGKEFKYSTLMP
ncbi:hypothetical protein ADIARSV_0804 [Arcticibacter svalbardensis MN12-7]|uniref:Uncharacterized protein n=1 Tax=Arcticibacter svalbardensis MN12-7 TaxID=1150600 RepID=R9GWE0_9SPHI|nr:hypothetical protein [Arcticibacter svalbardensis]EOR95988.1 hypothetical protein ADIARSV_0804 [Arcticibacter svalbardensis MN12-7]